MAPSPAAPQRMPTKRGGRFFQSLRKENQTRGKENPSQGKENQRRWRENQNSFLPQNRAFSKGCAELRPLGFVRRLYLLLESPLTTDTIPAHDPAYGAPWPRSGDSVRMTRFLVFVKIFLNLNIAPLPDSVRAHLVRPHDRLPREQRLIGGWSRRRRSAATGRRPSAVRPHRPLGHRQQARRAFRLYRLHRLGRTGLELLPPELATGGPPTHCARKFQPPATGTFV
jgi:hypothetical protein